MANPIRIYSKDICPYCIRAKNLLNTHGLEYTEINLDRQPELFTDLKQQTGWMTVPQIFIGNHFIGGFDELAEIERSGRLKEVLEE